MKIRIKGNIIRFRLTKSEVEYFGTEGYLEEKTEFLKSKFCYALKVTANTEDLSAEFSEGTITLFIPQHFAKQWTTTEHLGYRAEMNIGEGKMLYLILEKDYKCLDTVSEDQSDNYENPLVIK